MFKLLSGHPKPVQVIGYISYAIAIICALASFIINEIRFIFFAQIILMWSMVGELYYQDWFVSTHKQKNTKVNVLYLLLFTLSAILFLYPPLLKRIWFKIGKRFLINE
jgi:hypothetical protein